MKITLYTITDCQFSKQEKEYLSSHSLVFEEKNLETNRDFLTEMLTVSNNFAGTPVTKIEKDDGQIVVLKGFTKDEFDKTLGFTSPPPSQVAQSTVAIPQSQPSAPPVPQTPQPTPPTPSITPPKPVAPVEQPTPVTEPATPAPVPPPAVAQIPQQPPEASNPMSSVLNNLQEQASTPPPLPNIPDPKL